MVSTFFRFTFISSLSFCASGVFLPWCDLFPGGSAFVSSSRTAARLHRHGASCCCSSGAPLVFCHIHPIAHPRSIRQPANFLDRCSFQMPPVFFLIFQLVFLSILDSPLFCQAAVAKLSATPHVLHFLPAQFADAGVLQLRQCQSPFFFLRPQTSPRFLCIAWFFHVSWYKLPRWSWSRVYSRSAWCAVWNAWYSGHSSWQAACRR